MIGDNYQTDILGALDFGLDAIFFNRFPEHPMPQTSNIKHQTFSCTEVTSLRDIMGIL